jgi:hypothetical protein
MIRFVDEDNTGWWEQLGGQAVISQELTAIGLGLSQKAGGVPRSWGEYFPGWNDSRNVRRPLTLTLSPGGGEGNRSTGRFYNPSANHALDDSADKPSSET